MTEVEYAARALLAADQTFLEADADDSRTVQRREWDDLTEDAQEDYRSKAEVFLKAYVEAPGRVTA